jgi:tetratricopeptide (TPR) repeat protein
LRVEKRNAEADELLRAAYERSLALEQLQASTFASLARLALEKGDVQRGSKLLDLVVRLGNAEMRETAAAELAALDWVKARATDAEWVERPQPSNQIQEAEALRVAAETAAEFNQFAAAIEYRRQLSALAPEDGANRLELARVLAANGKVDDSMSQLALLISDRRALRQIRWTAAWIAPEIVKQEKWQSLEQQVRAGKDQEMVVAVEAQSLSSRGQSNEAIRRLSDAVAVNPGAQLRLLRALTQKNAGREREALQSLLDSMIASGDAWIAAPFAATEDEQRWQIVRLYSKQNRHRAALKQAGVDERLKGQSAASLPPTGDDEAARAEKAKPRFATLAARSNQRRSQSQIELLALLSVSAEQTGDLDKAIEFENARQSLSPDIAEQRKAESRIEQLKLKRKERERRPAPPLVINEQMVSYR